MEQITQNTDSVSHSSHTGIHPSLQAKIYFPVYLILKWKTHTLLINGISKLPLKKNSATCFVVSNQCNSISHLSFNLLFMVAEHSETYYPEFPLIGVQQQQAPIKPGCLFFILQLYSHQGQDGSICVLSRMTFRSRSSSNYLLPLGALLLGRQVSILDVISFQYAVAAGTCSQLAVGSMEDYCHTNILLILIFYSMPYFQLSSAALDYSAIFYRTGVERRIRERMVAHSFITKLKKHSFKTKYFL